MTAASAAVPRHDTVTNHAWRHTFKTRALVEGIDREAGQRAGRARDGPLELKCVAHWRLRKPTSTSRT